MKHVDGDAVAKILLGVVSAKFGPGAIGRIGTIAKAALAVLALMAVVFAFVNVYLSAGTVAAVVVLSIYWIHRSFKYADDHPELAAMDGAQIQRVLTQQASMRRLEGVPPPPPFVEEVIQNPFIEMHKEAEE